MAFNMRNTTHRRNASQGKRGLRRDSTKQSTNKQGNKDHSPTQPGRTAFPLKYSIPPSFVQGKIPIPAREIARAPEARQARGKDSCRQSGRQPPAEQVMGSRSWNLSSDYCRCQTPSYADPGFARLLNGGTLATRIVSWASCIKQMRGYGPYRKESRQISENQA